MKLFTTYFRSIILLITLLFFAFSLKAEKVEPSKAEQVANTFYTQKYELAKKTAPEKIDLELSFSWLLDSGLSTGLDNEADELFYIFNINKDKGFVIVAADDAAIPILAYSLDQSFTGENLPDALIYMLEGYAEQISEAIQTDAVANHRIKMQWAELLSGEPGALLKSVSAVNPLLTTTWNQSPYYNDLCPYDNTYGELTVSGCVATAMSQIMNYWEYPTTGVGYHSYNHDTYGTQSANFGATTYNWSAMPNNLNSPNQAVALIMQHCGVAVDMDYGVAQTGGSAAYVIEGASPVQHCVEYSLKTYFDYKTTMQGAIRQYYDDATWLQLMKTDLDAGRPIQYAGFGQGGGHTWVCDGYDNSNLFHMNWGWGGVYDAFYSLDNLSPGVGGAGGGSGSFSSGQQALIGIEPANGGGGGGGSNTIDLRAYSNIVVQPNPINFTGPFSVAVEVANFDENNFNGSLAAVLFNSDGDFVDIVQELDNITLESGYFNSYSFSSEGLLATPGEYFVGIYYKPTGGEYLIIGVGEYNNYVGTSIVGPENDMQMYSALAVSPLPVISGEAFEIVFDFANIGSQNFAGDISADLYDMDGNYLEELVSGSIELPSGYFIPLTLEIAGIDVEAGSYILAIWDKPNGADWQLVGSDEHPNPITIEIAAPQIQPDMYENNNEQGVSYDFSLSFSGTTASIGSNGSNIHEGNDLDFYKVDLPAGSQYRFDARVHDSYNSGNGNEYTDDVLWAFIVGNQVSEAYDDLAPGYFIVEGGQAIYFVVSNYYQGNKGTYLLDLQIEKGIFGVEEIEDEDFLTVFPNPSKGDINIDVENWNELGLPAKIEIFNHMGQLVFQNEKVSPSTNKLNIDMPNLKNGQYTLKVSGTEKYFDRQIIITK